MSRSTIHVRDAQKGVVYHLVVQGELGRLTGATLKQYVEQVSGAPARHQRLYVRSPAGAAWTLVEDSATGSALHLRQDCELRLEVPPLPATSRSHSRSKNKQRRRSRQRARSTTKSRSPLRVLSTRIPVFEESREAIETERQQSVAPLEHTTLSVPVSSSSAANAEESPRPRASAARRPLPCPQPQLFRDLRSAPRASNGLVHTPRATASPARPSTITNASAAGTSTTAGAITADALAEIMAEREHAYAMEAQRFARQREVRRAAMADRGRQLSDALRALELERRELEAELAVEQKRLEDAHCIVNGHPIRSGDGGGVAVTAAAPAHGGTLPHSKSAAHDHCYYNNSGSEVNRDDAELQENLGYYDDDEEEVIVAYL